MADETTVGATGAVTEETVNAEVQPGAESANADGTEQPTGEAKSGEHETEEQKKKRLGGWQRTIEKQKKQIDELQRKLGSQSSSPSASPAAASTAEKAPAKPKESDFQTYEEFEAAKDKYFEDLADFKAREVLKSARQQDERKQQQQEFAQKWKERASRFESEHKDFAEIAYNPELDEIIPEDSRIHEFITESDVGPGILYHLGRNLDEAARIAALPRTAQARELVALESKLAPQENKADEPEKPAVAQTRAPKPLSPTRKTGTVDDGELRDDLPPDEWKRRFLKKTEKK